MCMPVSLTLVKFISNGKGLRIVRTIFIKNRLKIFKRRINKFPDLL